MASTQTIHHSAGIGRLVVLITTHNIVRACFKAARLVMMNSDSLHCTAADCLSCHTHGVLIGIMWYADQKAFPIGFSVLFADCWHVLGKQHIKQVLPGTLIIDIACHVCVSLFLYSLRLRPARPQLPRLERCGRPVETILNCSCLYRQPGTSTFGANAISTITAGITIVQCTPGVLCNSFAMIFVVLPFEGLICSHSPHNQRAVVAKEAGDEQRPDGQKDEQHNLHTNHWLDKLFRKPEWTQLPGSY